MLLVLGGTDKDRLSFALQDERGHDHGMLSIRGDLLQDFH